MKSAVAGAIDDLVGPARQLDVAHRGFAASSHRSVRTGLPDTAWNVSGGHELLRAARHDDLHFGAALDQAADEVRALVGGDAAGDAEQNLARLRAHGADYGRGSRSRQTTRRIPAFRREWRARAPASDFWAYRRRLGSLAAICPTHCSPRMRSPEAQARHACRFGTGRRASGPGRSCCELGPHGAVRGGAAGDPAPHRRRGAAAPSMWRATC